MLASLVLPFLLAKATAETPALKPPQDATSVPRKAPIILEKSGGFNIGGKVIQHPVTNQTLTCDHGYMEYFIPWTPRTTGIVMWHSSSTQTFQNRWDGGEGFKDMFLRRDYPVYLWDAPRIGRAGWSCEPFYYQPDYRDSGNFIAWNFGPRPGEWWDDVQFPTENREYYWEQATGGRYIEFDTIANVHLQAEAAALSADYGMNGENIVYLTNSAAGLRAMMTVTKSNSTNIKSIVAYETVGLVYPEGQNITQGGPFGPFVVPEDDFKKLAQLKEIQFVFGDHRDESYMYVREARKVAELINGYGGNANVLKLGEDAGLLGSTHVAFADMDNDKVAGLLDELLARNGLDGY
ncbi:uncharacterized protein DNG_04399 [Cephalotrichum gorgonifer]|uniref:Alpha/beta-hydrolase n=1 Tax=Cephalotrichum gorgonifer TaxID=2041049 RepID=A0AAE8SUI4_9PEZI|nr:uncharacterized protein DNG_04399 [Cephalotrichum gorgonifer]